MTDWLAKLNAIEDRPRVRTDPGHRLPDTERWGFLSPSPFTRAMLERATERWQEPLSTEDWADIERGAYLFEHRMAALRRYLYQWRDDNPGRMAELVEQVRSGTGWRSGLPSILQHRSTESTISGESTK